MKNTPTRFNWKCGHGDCKCHGKKPFGSIAEAASSGINNHSIHKGQVYVAKSKDGYYVGLAFGLLFNNVS